MSLSRPPWLPAGIGASPKTLAILGVLVVALAVTIWSNMSSDDAPAAKPAASAPTQARVPALRKIPEAVPDSGSSGPTPARRNQARGGIRTVEEFHPTLKVPEDLDVSKIDPTLREDLLAKVRQVGMAGGSRNLFEFSKPPEPPAPKVTIVPVPPPAPVKSTPAEPVKSGPPPPPPIPLKYYGYAKPTADGKLRGMFLEGDPTTGEFYYAAENEMIKGRFKVIRIGVKSAELEDISYENKQSMPLVEEQSP